MSAQYVFIVCMSLIACLRGSEDKERLDCEAKRDSNVLLLRRIVDSVDPAEQLSPVSDWIDTTFFQHPSVSYFGELSGGGRRRMSVGDCVEGSIGSWSMRVEKWFDEESGDKEILFAIRPSLPRRGAPVVFKYMESYDEFVHRGSIRSEQEEKGEGEKEASLGTNFFLFALQDLRDAHPRDERFCTYRLFHPLYEKLYDVPLPTHGGRQDVIRIKDARADSRTLTISYMIRSSGGKLLSKLLNKRAEFELPSLAGAPQ